MQTTENQNQQEVTVADPFISLDAKMTAATKSIELLSAALADVNAKVDVLLQNTQIVQTVQPKNDQPMQPVEPVEMGRIESEDDANKFEIALSYAEYKKQLRKEFFREFGQDIGPYGKVRIAHDVRNKMFSNKFFTLCSWSGTSIKNRGDLLAFSKYEKTIKFLCEKRPSRCWTEEKN